MLAPLVVLAPPHETQQAIVLLRDYVRRLGRLRFKASSEELLMLLNTALYLPHDMPTFFPKDH